MNRRHYFILTFVLLLFSACKKNEIEDIPECNCFIETALDTYTYPIRPGSEEWKAFTSSDQMAEATQIPFTVLDIMSTMGVFESCAESPLSFDLYIVMEPQRFYDFFKNTFNVCQELINRDDAGIELIKRYSLMCSKCTDNNYSSFSGKGGDVKYSFVSIELLLAQEDILSKISKVQCIELGQLLIKVNENNIRNNLSIFFKLFPVWIASRIMVRYNYSEFMKLKLENKQISIFNETGIPLLGIGSDYTEEEIFREIMQNFKMFLNNES